MCDLLGIFYGSKLFEAEIFNACFSVASFGGIFGARVLWLDQHSENWKPGITVSTNAKLCVLPWCASGNVTCVALDLDSPYSLIAEHERTSAERPASVTHASLSSAVPPVIEHEGFSAERPAGSFIVTPEPPSATSARLKANTQLYDQFLADLEEGGEDVFPSARAH